MSRFTLALCLLALLGTSPGTAAESASSSPSNAPRFDCDEESETCTCYLHRGSEDCRRMLDTGRCRAPEEVGRPWTGEDDARRDGFAWIDYLDCYFTKGTCTCDLVTGPAGPGTPTSLTDRQPTAVGESLQPLEEPVTPMEDEVRTMETVPGPRDNSPGYERKMATDRSKNAPVTQLLVAPSELAVVHEARTILRLAWQDNSTREFGVEVYRLDPEKARAAGVASWEFVGTFDERNRSNGRGTGRRSAEDFGLQPGTHYCYRLRAYRGFDRAEVSDYSAIACGLTAR